MRSFIELRGGEEAKKMNVWNKVLMILTGLLCAAYAVFAANVYQNNKDWRQKNDGLEEQIAKQLEDNVKLYNEVYGGDASVDVQSWKDCGLDGQLAYIRSLEAGDVFVNCEAAETKIDDSTGSAKVMFGVDPQYNMSSFRDGAVVYLFDSGVAFKKASADATAGTDETVAEAPAEPIADDADSEAGAEPTATVAAAAPYVFLGAFKIVGAAAAQVNLETIGVFTEAELALLDATRKGGRSFVACVDRLPVDSPADVADFVAEKPGVVAGYGAQIAADMAKKTADATALAGCLGADEATTAANFEQLFATNAEVRVPVAYQARLERQWSTRNAQNVMIARNTLALADMDYVIAEQLVLMGDKPSKGLESDYEELLARTSKFEGFDAVYDAAKARKRVASYFERIDATRDNLAKMKADVALVEGLVAEAEQNNKDCQEAIDNLVAQNSKLASEIARVMFAVSEKLESRSATASVDNSAILNR